MKTRLLSLALMISAPLAMAADGPLKEKALAVAEAHRDSVLFLTAVTEVEMTAGDAPARKEERKVETLATVISKDGLVVAPLSTLDPAMAIDGRTVNGPQGPMKISAKGTTKEVKLLMPDGSEHAAKVTFKDPDLDLAFVRLENADGLDLKPVGLEESAEMGMLDDVIVLGRLGKALNRQPVVMTSEVISVISKPRVFGKIGAQSLGMPVFNGEGKFVGLGINRFNTAGADSGQGPMPSNVVLPAADLIESAGQAK